jgi:uncharacterized membrane protein YfcA
VDSSLVVDFLILGAVVGFAAGLLGIGGGILIVPCTVFLLSSRGFPPEVILHLAIATSLGTIMFTSISSMRAHHRQGAVLWRAVAMFAPGIVIGSWIGPWLGKQLHAPVLGLVFAAFLALSATQMLLQKKGDIVRELPNATGMIAMGGLIGMLAGLLGAGGAFVSVPFMTRCNVKIHHAVATSAALGFPIALTGTLSNVYYGWNTPGLPPGSLGFIYLPALLVISLASVSTAPLGARTAHKMEVKSLRKVFAVLLYLLAAYMAYQSI